MAYYLVTINNNQRIIKAHDEDQALRYGMEKFFQNWDVMEIESKSDLEGFVGAIPPKLAKELGIDE